MGVGAKRAPVSSGPSSSCLGADSRGQGRGTCGGLDGEQELRGGLWGWQRTEGWCCRQPTDGALANMGRAAKIDHAGRMPSIAPLMWRSSSSQREVPTEPHSLEGVLTWAAALAETKSTTARQRRHSRSCQWKGGSKALSSASRLRGGGERQLQALLVLLQVPEGAELLPAPHAPCAAGRGSAGRPQLPRARWRPEQLLLRRGSWGVGEPEHTLSLHVAEVSVPPPGLPAVGATSASKATTPIPIWQPCRLGGFAPQLGLLLCTLLPQRK